MQQKNFQHVQPLRKIPICVDLDHTLVKSDTLVESLLVLFRQKPLSFLKIIAGISRSRALTKSLVADHVDLDPAILPYNQDIVFYLRRMKSRGHEIYLVTGANRKIAESIASHLNLFDGVFASSSEINLTGQKKRDLLVRKFGEKGFQYIGDSKTDLAVWRHAKEAILVRPTQPVKRSANLYGNVTKTFERKSSTLRSTIKALRIHQWSKNVLIFIPLMLAHRYTEPSTVIQAFFGFLAFCSAASCIYIINDLFDLHADRLHRDKKNRPFASGELPLLASLVLVPVTAAFSVIATSFMPVKFTAILIAYLLTTNLYTFFLKRLPIADIITLSGLYSIRLLAGGAATEVALSPWLLAFSGFFFISLAMIKRVSELLMLRDSGRTKSLGRGYRTEDISLLTSLGSASGFGAVVVLALYINSGIARILYQHNEFLWLLCPTLIYWLSRMWFLTNRKQIHSDPVKFALRDNISWIVIFVSSLIWLAARGF